MKAPITLSTSVQYVHGIGPRRAEALQQQGINTVHDLLYYFPRQYLDRTTIVRVNDLKRFLYSDREVTVVGRVRNMNLVRGKGTQRLVLKMQDDSGSLDCIFFAKPQLFAKMFSVGELLALSGKPQIFQHHLQFTHPDFDRLSQDEDEIDWDKAFHTGSIIPQYPTTEKLREVKLDSRGFRRIQKNLIENMAIRIPEFLPDEILGKRKLLNCTSALRAIHFPSSLEQLETARRRLKYDELFFLQILFALRRKKIKSDVKGISFNTKSRLARTLVDALPFELTHGQKKVIREIAADMESDKPMNRLLQGDVGSGKTIIALLSMLVAVENGYQAVFMAPTEILAEQHFSSMTKLLENIPVSINLLLGGQKKKIRDTISEDIREGNSNIIVGTHALIQGDVTFKNLGLVVIDEQHRFGVLQRLLLREKAKNPDVLVMTATPIPRTLAMTLYGDLDVSTLDEVPKSRRIIKTRLVTNLDREKVYSFIRNEVEKGRQAFVVYPLIEESEKLDLQAATKGFEYLRDKEYSKFKVGLVHGRMSTEERQKVMMDFRAGVINILVSTTVIEVGVDIPNATVMLVENAERFGLSQLHQLRGRVGRGVEQSYCLLMTYMNDEHKKNKIKNIFSSEEERAVAIKRLHVMESTTDGFKIAEADLALRGPGEYFGTKQSGLPEFQIADPVVDRTLATEARDDAFQIIESDPHLRSEELSSLREHFIERYKQQLTLVQVG